MAVPATRNKILPARGNYADLNANVASLLDGEICYAIDQDQYYQKEGTVLVSVGATKAQGALADTALQPLDNVSELTNDAGYVDTAGASAAAPVQSVAGKTGAVTLVKADITDFSDADYATAAQGVLADTALQSGDTIEFAPGTAAAPGLYPTGDTNTGIYSPGADTVGVSTAGTERMRIDSAGNVGIGTSSPDVTLHLGTTPAGAGSAGVIGFGDISNYRVAEIEGYREGVSFAGSLIFKTQTFGSSGNSGAERMRINSSGNVGIGTTSPTAKLELGTNAGGGNSIRLNSGGNSFLQFTSDSTNGGVHKITAGNSATGGGTIAFETATGGVAAEHARIDSAGRFLIGTTSGTFRSTLKLQGNSDSATEETVLRLCKGTTSVADGDALGSIFFSDSLEPASAVISAERDGGTWSASSKPGRLTFSTTADGASTSTERMRISSSGNVNIDSGTFYVDAVNNVVAVGSATPSIYGSNALLVNNNTLTINQDAANEPVLQFRSGTATQLGRIQYPPSGLRFVNVSGVAEAMRITSTGKVGIGTSSPGGTLDIKAPASTAPLIVQGPSSEFARIDSSGRLLVGTTTGTAGYGLTVANGDIDIQANAIGTTTVDGDIDLDANGAGLIQVTEYNLSQVPVVTQHDIGTAANEIPLNGMLGSMAFQDADAFTGTFTGSITAGTAAAPSLSISGDSDTGIYSPGADTVGVSTAGTERMRIDSAGRVLVGTSSAFSTANVGTSYQIGLEKSGSYAAAALRTNTANQFGSYLTFSKSRGTTNNANTIVSTNDVLGQISFEGADGSAPRKAAVISAEVDGTPGTNDMPGRLVFSTTADGASSPTERMRINSAGYMKASKTGSYENVNGQFYEFKTDQNDTSILVTNDHASLGGTTAGIHIKYTAATPNSTTSNFLRCQDATAVRLQIRSNGGIENYQSNNVDLSDERTKRNIEPASSTWGCVQAWEVVNYNYIDDAIDDTSRIGVIAQQVKQHCPEIVIPYQEAEDAVIDENGNVVTPAKEERLGVREQQMMWMAIKALQEAQIRIEQLEAKVAALESA